MLPKAYQRSIWYKAQGYKVKVGGPAVWAIPKYLWYVAEIGGEGEVDALIHHNPQATMASRGCQVGCYFCIVPAMEGKTFTLIPDFTPRPILVDNNLSALPVEYQEHIIRRYQESDTPLLDANSGFEPHKFDEDTYRRWKVINRGPWRFSLDEMRELEDVRRMMLILKDEKSWNKRVYVLTILSTYLLVNLLYLADMFKTNPNPDISGVIYIVLGMLVYPLLVWCGTQGVYKTFISPR